MQLLRGYTSEILSAFFELKIGKEDTLGRPQMNDVLTNMHPIFKGAIVSLYLNNKEGFIWLLEAFFTISELKERNKEVTEFWDGYILPLLRAMKVGCLFDINSITYRRGKCNLFGIQSKEVTNT